MGLADQQCVPCRGGVPPLPHARIETLLKELDSGWALNAAGHLLRTYEFRDFAAALAFELSFGAEPPRARDDELRALLTS